MEREELMKARLTEVGKKQGMIDDTDGSASIEYILGFDDGWHESDAHPKSPWVSVHERLPEAGVEVVVADGSHCQVNVWEVGTYTGWRYGTGRITHWMPIPELPEEGGTR